MPSNRLKKPIPNWAQVIRARREKLHLTQDELADKTNGVVAQRTVSNLETARTHIKDMTAERLAALTRVLDWTMPKLQEATGIDFAAPLPLDASSFSVETIFKTASGTAYATRPQFHDNDYLDPAVVHILPDDDYPGLEIWIASGSSMEPEIEDGATLYVDTRDTRPVDGLIYVFRIPGDGACVKRVRNVGGTLWLQSDNADHEAFQVEEANIVGRVDMSQPKPKKVRRR